MPEKDLQKEILDLKAQIKKLQKNHLGLVFEDKPEGVVTDCQQNIPVLKEVKSKRIVSGEQNSNNLLIEGDNYHSLSVLNYTHKEKIDLIYIDPPYNTGNHDFIYNDQYVDNEDAYRHSKWLSFMNNRLRLAKDLLKDNGAIFISIDDNEQAHLRVLCDKIFGGNNFIASIIWQKKYTQSNDAKYFSATHDYILCYAKKAESYNVRLLPRTEKQDARYKNPDNDPRGPWMTQPLHAKSGSDKTYSFTFKNGVTWSPPVGTYPRFSKESLKKADEENAVWFGAKSTAVPRLKKYLKEMKQGVIPKTIWLYDEAGSNDDARRELKELDPDNTFDSPKPTSLIKRIINLSGDNDINVLDFFAGSGTTGHAVLKLNAEDGGSRKFILCTNNEDNNGSGKKIATDICYPRIKKVIKGFSDMPGIPSNLFYYKTDLVDIEHLHKISDDAKVKVTYQAGEMIAVREDTLNEVEKNDWWQIFEGRGRMTAIYFKEDKAKLAELIAKLEKKDIPVALYIFSWGKNEYKGEYSSANIRVEDIPEPILEVYKELNRL